MASLATVMTRFASALALVKPPENASPEFAAGFEAAMAVVGNFACDLRDSFKNPSGVTS